MRIPVRYLIGSLTAPLIIPAAFYALEREIAGTVLIALVVSYLGMAVIGIPCIIWLNKIKKLSIVNLCICGAIGGALVWLVFAAGFSLLFASTDQEIKDYIYSILIGGVMGFVVALVFGLTSGIPILRCTANDT